MTVNVDLNDGFEWTVIIVPDTLVYHAPIKWSGPMTGMYITQVMDGTPCHFIGSET